MLVKNHELVDDIGADLSQMTYIIAGLCTAAAIAVIIGKHLCEIV